MYYIFHTDPNSNSRYVFKIYLWFHEKRPISPTFLEIVWIISHFVAHWMKYFAYGCCSVTMFLEIVDSKDLEKQNTAVFFRKILSTLKYWGIEYTFFRYGFFLQFKSFLLVQTPMWSGRLLVRKDVRLGPHRANWL